MRVAAELGDAGLEGIARAGGLVEKQQKDGLVRQVAVRHAFLEHEFQLGRRLQREFEFLAAPILRRDVGTNLIGFNSFSFG